MAEDLVELIKNCHKSPYGGGPDIGDLKTKAEKYGIKNAKDLTKTQICAKLKALKDIDSAAECVEDKSLKDRDAPPYKASACPGKIKRGGDGHNWKSVISGSGFIWEKMSKADVKALDKKKKEKEKEAKKEKEKGKDVYIGWRSLKDPSEIPISEVRKDQKLMEHHCKYLKDFTKKDLASPIARRSIGVIALDTRTIVHKYQLDKKSVGLVQELSLKAFEHNCKIIQAKLSELVDKKGYY